jgi:alpha-glucosidase
MLLALLFTLKGTVLMYQGEELGLPEADLRRDQLRDPVGDLYYPQHKGRDGCRTPMPWDASAPKLGFTSGAPWLPLSPLHRPLAVSAQENEPASVLKFARYMLSMRKKHPALRFGEIEFLDAPESILAFKRTHVAGNVTCVFNMGVESVSFGEMKLAACGHQIEPA